MSRDIDDDVGQPLLRYGNISATAQSKLGRFTLLSATDDDSRHLLAAMDADDDIDTRC